MPGVNGTIKKIVSDVGFGPSASDARRVTLVATTHVQMQVACTSCERSVELECEGLGGVWSYSTHNEFFCPFCRKLNHARTPGAIVSVREAPGTPAR